MKAVFMDYTGTITVEDSPCVRKMVLRCFEHSNIGSPKEMLAYWWKKVKKYEAQSYLESYITEDEIVDRVLSECEQEIGLKDDKDELHSLCRECWSKSPVFDDVKEFFEKCPLPVYLVTNNGVEYVKTAMDDNGLHPEGIICGDMVRAYKPHREIFLKALEISRCAPDEVIHVGDSVESDVKGAESAGIRAVLLDRTGKAEQAEILTVHSLTELLSMEMMKQCLLHNKMEEL